MKITGIDYNWKLDGGVFNRTVGKTHSGLCCDKIVEHPAAGEGDKWFYDIYYSDGSMERIFNPNRVFKTEDEL